MEKLKDKVFEVLFCTLSINEFEKWLYHDEYVIVHILDSEVILELMTINFKAKDALEDIERVCFTYFGKEAFLDAVVKKNCKKFLAKKSDHALDMLFYTIDQFYYWECENYLVNQFHFLESSWQLALGGYESKKRVIANITSFATLVVNGEIDKIKKMGY